MEKDPEGRALATLQHKRHKGRGREAVTPLISLRNKTLAPIHCFQRDCWALGRLGWGWPGGCEEKTWNCQGRQEKPHRPSSLTFEVFLLPISERHRHVQIYSYFQCFYKSVVKVHDFLPDSHIFSSSFCSCGRCNHGMALRVEVTLVRVLML